MEQNKLIRVKKVKKGKTIIIIVNKQAIILRSVPKRISKKTNIGLGKLFIDHCSKQEYYFGA